MAVPLSLSELAQSDVRNARRWYDVQRAGLGDEFLADLDKACLRIAEFPRRYAIAEADVRHRVLGRFPYIVYYRELPDCVVVIAIVHAHRDPQTWRSRI